MPDTCLRFYYILLIKQDAPNHSLNLVSWRLSCSNNCNNHLLEFVVDIEPHKLSKNTRVAMQNIYLNTRSLEEIFKAHIDNTIECGKKLGDLFNNLASPDEKITQIKELEENGDKLTAEAYFRLENFEYTDFIHVLEQLVKRLDDIIDGINNTARLIDICHPREIENAAYDILANLIAMLEKLESEIIKYPKIEINSIKESCKVLKFHEQQADLIYHQWRKKQRRVLVLSLIEENNWTEILGVLEQTTDAAYHTGLLLERIARFHDKI